MITFPDTRKRSLSSLFSQHYPNDVLLRSYFEGSTPGIAYVDDLQSPAFCLVISEFYHWTFIGGHPSSNQVELACKAILPQEQYLQILWRADLGLEKPQLEWDEVVSRKEFLRFAWPPTVQKDDVGPPVNRTTLATMPSSFLKTTLKYFYGSWEEFLSKAFAYQLFLNDRLVSEAVGILQSSLQMEVSIETAEPFRRKGYGRLVATALIEEALRNGKEPCWSCNSDNAPSLEIAKSLGFSDPQEYSILIVNQKDALSQYWKSLLDRAQARQKSLGDVVAYLQSQGLERNVARRISIAYFHGE